MCPMMSWWIVWSEGELIRKLARFITFSPPEDDEVLARLEQRSDDTEEKVVVRLEEFRANVDAVKGIYGYFC